MQRIRVGIVGYGNLGRSVELGLSKTKDMELAGVFTRRDPSSIKTVTEGVMVYQIDDAQSTTDQIDVMILCGGSMSDIPVQGPLFASMFNTVDGYDTHAKIPEYFDHMSQASANAKKVSVISTGWDPGMFSIQRIYAEAILPDGKTFTFWGPGISQGHSDAIRRIRGVKDAKQYTIPNKDAVDAVTSGAMPELATADKHNRVCYVVAEEGADKAQIEKEIKTMPNYFAEYDTEVNFITEEELAKNHSGLPHGGLVMHYGKTGIENENSHMIEYHLKLDSNPDFTANVLIAYARAAYRLNQEGVIGAKTVADIAPAYLSEKSSAEIRKTLI